MASALGYLHSKSIAHRDVKATNVLLTDSMTVKICDFGVSKDTQAAGDLTISMKGTAAYMSPELWNGDMESNADAYYKSDVYAFAILLNFMSTKVEPESELGVFPYQIMAAVTSGKRPAVTSGNQTYQSVSLVTLIQACWAEDPSKRPNFARVLEELGCIEDQCMRADHVSRFA